jgi:hypothetical protein
MNGLSSSETTAVITDGKLMFLPLRKRSWPPLQRFYITLLSLFQVGKTSYFQGAKHAFKEGTSFSLLFPT